jgi:acetyl esterase/lipase
MSSVRLAALALLVCGIAACGSAPAGPPRPSRLQVRLWPDRAPVGDGTSEECETGLVVYLPTAEKNTGAAIVVCPGGGYIRHVMDREGYPIGEWLAANGITAILLKYRLPEGRPLVPLLDAGRALRIVRAFSKEWEVDPGRVGILGFSAGGHVASTAGTHFDAGRAEDPDPVERWSSRPDFMLLVYAVISMTEKPHALSKTKLLGADPSPEMVRRFSNELQIGDRTPPAFLAHAKDDSGVPPEHSQNFVAAMKSRGLPVEYLELPSGGHGLNGCKGPLWEQWKAASLLWLTAQGVLPPAPR